MSKYIDVMPDNVEYNVKSNMGEIELFVAVDTTRERVELCDYNSNEVVRINANTLRNLIDVLEDSLSMINGKIEECEDA